MKKAILILITCLSILICGACNNTTPPEIQTKQYKIDLVYDDIVKDTFYVLEDNKFEKPKDPTKDGYIFDGWYLDYGCEEIFSFDTLIKNDMTLYGKFTKLWNIEYFGLEEYNTTIKDGDLIVEPNNPTKENYKFIGWYKDIELTIPFIFNIPINKDLIIYPKWENVTQYKVSFQTNSETKITDQLITINNLITVPDTPIKEGYKFNGWYLDDKLFDFKTPVTKDLTLTAGWIKYYTISFNENIDDLIVLENEEFKLPIPVKDGFIFLGWFIDDKLFTEDVKIDRNYNLTSKWQEVNIDDTSLLINSFSGYNEGAYVEFNKVAGFTTKSSYFVYYKPSNTADYIEVDRQLIQENEVNIRCDILGLKAGTYDIKIVVSNLSKELKNIVVSSYDRSGYAHFNTSSSVGGYNNDGTVKDNAIIVYVTEENKNTVTATINGKTYTGISEILKNQSKGSNPLIVRIIGKITAATWNPIEYNGDPLKQGGIKDKNGNKITSNLSEEEIISLGVNTLNITKDITKLNGLSNRLKYSSSEYDSYFNSLDISNAKNITLEGVGPNAMLFQWGITWKNCSYIEVRNLTFEDFPEDACSFEGSETKVSSFEDFKTGHIWVHHNTFNEGINYWDVTSEQDKHDGDGSLDLKGNIYITISYNHFYKNHKTGLVGGGDSVTTACVTFHHNFYDQCSSRLPLGRQANMHMYNNYYYKSSGTNMSIRAGAFAFVENCVFESCNNPMQTVDGDNKKGVIKAFNNIITNCKGSNNSIEVTNREQSVNNDNVFHKTFDTDENWFYYDSVNKKSNVSVMHNVDEVKDFCINNTGVLRGDFVNKDIVEELPPISTDNTVLSFNNFNSGSISSLIDDDVMTIYPKEGKTCKIVEKALTINGYTINKYISFGGGGSINSLCLSFNTTKQANITVYYSSGGSSERYVKLFSEDMSLKANTPTVPGDDTQIVSYTFSNISPGNLYISSYNSGINVYLIVIEYLN